MKSNYVNYYILYYVSYFINLFVFNFCIDIYILFFYANLGNKYFYEPWQSHSTYSVLYFRFSRRFQDKCFVGTTTTIPIPRPCVILTLILRRSRTGTVRFYTSASNKSAAPPKLYTKSLTRDLKFMYSRLTLVRISINL